MEGSHNTPQAFVIRDNEMSPLTSPDISLRDEGHGCRDKYAAQSEMKVNPAHLHRKSLACTQFVFSNRNCKIKYSGSRDMNEDREVPTTDHPPGSRTIPEAIREINWEPRRRASPIHEDGRCEEEYEVSSREVALLVVPDSRNASTMHTRGSKWNRR